MKKLTVVLIAVFLFPASFVLGGEHPALADERPSLVNDDLAFAFYGDVPLRAQFMSRDEMQQITGNGLPAVFWAALVKWTKRIAIGTGGVGGSLGAIEFFSKVFTEKEASAHANAIWKLAVGYLIKNPPNLTTEASFEADFEKAMELPPGKQQVAVLQAAALRAAINDAVVITSSLVDAINYALDTHYQNEVDNMLEDFGLEDHYVEGMTEPPAGALVAEGLGMAYAAERTKKAEEVLRARIKANIQGGDFALELADKIAELIEETPDEETTPSKSTSTGTSTTKPSKSTSTGTSTTKPNNYTEDAWRNMLAGDRNHGGPWGYGGGRWGGYIGGYQTGYCSGNTCTVTYHRGRFWGSRYRR